MDLLTLIYISILVLSIVVHEVSHGYMAYMLGDSTAKMQGRLTMNPIKHLDPIGSVILPSFLVLSGSPVLFGWAKPVPYNPYNLKKGGRFAEALVAFAGPLSNITIAVFVAFLFHIGLVSLSVALLTVSMNLFLALLNMLPIPPLDGSKILPALLPHRYSIRLNAYMRHMESGGIFTMFIAILIIITFFASFISGLVSLSSKILLGL